MYSQPWVSNLFYKFWHIATVCPPRKPQLDHLQKFFPPWKFLLLFNIWGQKLEEKEVQDIPDADMSLVIKIHPESQNLEIPTN